MTTQHSRRGDAPDRTYCHRTVQDVSRTFALTVDQLAAPMADYVCVGYLLCRIPDTVEDTTHVSPERRVALLETYRDALDPGTDTTADDFAAAVAPRIPDRRTRPDERDADWRLVADAPTVLATFADFDPAVRAAMRPPILELVDGMTRFVDRYADEDGLRIQTDVELRSYCHYVAGTVGTLVTNLLARQSLPAGRANALRTNAEHFGRLLQLVNVAKDVRDDYATERNVYLPADWLAAEGVSQDRLLADENRSGVARVVERVVERAKSHRDGAEAYLQAMPLGDGNTVVAWALPYLLAVGTLRELSKRPADAATDRPVKVSREEVAAVAAAVRDGGRESIPRLRETISRAPLHRADGA
ncbi:squalene/phytoene synthase family protein [Halobacterium litoreum]|uniref:Squalene/phytoene synthase family protein n=1 Tax=Halobacterium litoreum TaxID=2039234 RepID=A0ABD5NG40_9EURY|nr:squalene/phytoene synthase family protein [Halobacterium litoreum]UHH12918.1 squalene/phytoene synthase family protein [Halobacterium litoreum]